MEKQHMRNLGIGLAAGLVVGAVGMWVVSKPSAGKAGRGSCFLSGAGSERVLAAVDGNDISSANLPVDLQQSYLQAESEYMRRLGEISDEVAVRYAAAKEQNRAGAVSDVPSFKEIMGELVKDSDVREFFEKNKQSFPKMEFSQVEAMLRRHLEQQKQNTFVQGKLVNLKKEKRLVSKLPIPCGPKAAASVPAGSPAKGNGSKVELVFVSDFQCGPCRYIKASLDRLLEQNSDRIQVVQVMSPGAPGSANEYLVRGSYCASKQDAADKFWSYHNSAYFTPVQYDAAGKVQDGPEVKKAALDTAARAGLDVATFEHCIIGKESEEFVAKNREYLAKVKIEQAPAFFLNGRRLGVPPQLNVDEILTDVMDEVSPAKAAPKAEPTKK